MQCPAPVFDAKRTPDLGGVAILTDNPVPAAVNLGELAWIEPLGRGEARSIGPRPLRTIEAGER